MAARRHTLAQMLDASERERLTGALEVWLDRHPSPDEPAILVSGEGELSPRETVKAVVAQSELGEAVLQILEFSVRRSSLEEVATSFEHALLVEH